MESDYDLFVSGIDRFYFLIGAVKVVISCYSRYEVSETSHIRKQSTIIGFMVSNAATAAAGAAKQSDPSISFKNKSRKIPSGYKLTGSVKEQHGHSIYCVAWSGDEFSDDGKVMVGQEPQEEEQTDSSGDEADKEKETNGSDATRKKSQSWAANRTLLYFATCGGNRVTLYEVAKSDPTNPERKPGLILRQGYIDADEEEVFYSCVFGGHCIGDPVGYGPLPARKKDGESREDLVVIDSQKSEDQTARNNRKRPRESDGTTENQQPAGTKKNAVHMTLHPDSFNGPQLLCVAGTRGVIKVIDPVRRMLFTTLSGHGDDIYDLKFSPTHEWLILSASKDESLRLWNVKTSTCVAIFAGHEGHRDCVLSVGWHPHGHKFVSGGMDTTVKLWNVGEDTDVGDAIRKSENVKPQLWDAKVLDKQKFTTIYEQMPLFSTHKVHTNYVDCVQFVGDLVLSKDTNETIVLWMPDASQANRTSSNSKTQHRLPSEVIALREFNINKCDVWFMRFQTDWDCQLLALGNTVGEIRVWEVGANPTKKHFCTLMQQYCVSAVRMVAFSPDSKLLLASCDDASIWVWEASHS